MAQRYSLIKATPSIAVQTYLLERGSLPILQNLVSRVESICLTLNELIYVQPLLSTLLMSRTLGNGVAPVRLSARSNRQPSVVCVSGTPNRDNIEMRQHWIGLDALCYNRSTNSIIRIIGSLTAVFCVRIESLCQLVK